MDADKGFRAQQRQGCALRAVVVVEGRMLTLPGQRRHLLPAATGVEIVDGESVTGQRFYTIRDMRNGHVIRQRDPQVRAAVELRHPAV